jgi:predicted permease
MLETVLHILVYLVLGYLLRLITGDRSKPLITLVLYLVFPAVILSKVPRMEAADEILFVSLAALLLLSLSMGAAYLIARKLKADRATTATLMMVSGLGNTSFVGFPYVKGLLGSEALGYAVVYDTFAGFLPLILVGTVIVTWGADKKIAPLNVAKELLRFPPFIVFFTALLIPADFFPTSAEPVFDFFETVLTPLTILAVGMRIDLSRLRNDLKLPIIALGLKMLLQPLLLLAVVFCCFDTTALSYGTFILESAMPPMVMAAVFAINAGLRVDLAINAVVLGIAVSFITVPLFYLAVNV